MVANDAKLFVGVVRVARSPSRSDYQASDAKLRKIACDFRFIRSLDAAMDAEDELQLMILEQEIAIAYACR
mgnify:CR=1 FL=1